MSVPCPVCGATAHIRTSRPMSPITREQYYHCTNPRCHHVFVAMLSVVRTVGDSMLPKPEQSGWPFGYAVPKSRRAQPEHPPDHRQILLPGLHEGEPALTG
jgi:Ogr/Delta-like zinc finger protein